jgi:hypothetical protein
MGIEMCPACGSHLIDGHGMWLRLSEVIYTRACRKCGELWERREPRAPWRVQVSPMANGQPPELRDEEQGVCL